MLANAARLYEKDRGSRPAPDWTLFHGPAELASAQTELFTAAGHHRAAVSWLRRSLERQEATYARNEALQRAGLAGAIARSGEAEEAAHHLEQGEALLTEVSSGRARESLAVARREPMRSPVECATVTDTVAAGRELDDLAPVSEAVFAEPPYNEGPRDVAEFLKRYQREHKTPGFRLALARDGSELAGFTYGLPLASTTGWWSGFQDTDLPEEFTREDGHRTFVVMELAVLTGWRGRGVGRALHAALLDGVTAERATLTVRPEASAAAWYERLGYELVGLTQPWDGAPIYRSMIKSLELY
ncbi:GNAT family N-acetyltransferase [Streptomyces sp. NPDC059979]|uniref:GNAT family N-acetyltransferase n=1 Tax=Streptomyces sp. NPDC059979 TaxID=3347021 RepID=UPI0036CAE24F